MTRSATYVKSGEAETQNALGGAFVAGSELWHAHVGEDPAVKVFHQVERRA